MNPLQKEPLEDCSQKLPKASSDGICIVIQGFGPIISFKNKKRGGIGRRKDGSKYAMSWTPRNVKDWMEIVTQNIVLQLCGLFPTEEGETHGECQKRLLTASLMPLDDSLDWMLPGNQEVRMVEKGQEGAIIIITEIK